MVNSVGFKEWKRVCDLLGLGESSLILRKGGIHEGRAGFNFKHEAFWLFPTFFHAQDEGLILPPCGEVFAGDAEREIVSIQFFAKIEALWNLDQLEQLALIRPWHDWTDQVVLDRFHYGEGNGLHVAAVRVFALPESWSFPYEKKYGGCRSWVQIPECPSDLLSKLQPVLSDQAHHSRLNEIKHALQHVTAF